MKSPRYFNAVTAVPWSGACSGLTVDDHEMRHQVQKGLVETLKNQRASCIHDTISVEKTMYCYSAQILSQFCLTLYKLQSRPARWPGKNVLQI